MSFTTIVRLALSNYHDDATLSRSPLLREDAVKACLLDGDSAPPLLFALRGTLDWGLEQLRKTENAHALVSYDLLTKRYMEKMSASAYADIYLVSEATSQSRRKAAINRLSKILQQEFASPTATHDRQQRMLALRYEACSPDEQAVLRFLALAEEPIFFEIAKTVDIVPIEMVLPTLIALNLLRVNDAGRVVQLHPQSVELIKEHGELIESRQFHTAYARFYEQRQQYDIAITHWQHAGEMVCAADLLLTHHTTFRFDLIRHKVAQFRSNDVPADTWTQLCLLAGRAAVRTDDLESAIQQFRLANRTTNSTLKAQAHLGLIRVYKQVDIDKASVYCDMCQRMVAMLTTPDKIVLQAQLFVHQAWIAIQKERNFDDASDALGQAKTLIETYRPEQVDSELYPVEYEWYITHGASYRMQGQLQEAADHYWQAWQLAQTANEIEHATKSTHNLGTIYVQLEEYDKGIMYYEESFHYASVNHNDRMIALNQKGLGYCAFWQKRYTDAADHYTQAYTYFKANNDSYWLASVCYDLAEAHLYAGEAEIAAQYVQEGVALSNETGNESLANDFAELCVKYSELAAERTPRQREIISYVRQNGSITRPQCSELTGLQARRATTLLTELVNEKILMKEGKGKATRYILP